MSKGLGFPGPYFIWCGRGDSALTILKRVPVHSRASDAPSGIVTSIFEDR